MKVTNLKEVVEYQLCCGCGVCAYFYPEEMEMIDCRYYGRRPRFKDHSKKHSKEALSVCPGARLEREKEDFLGHDGYQVDLFSEWGPILQVYEGYAADEEIRHRGSSGGGITALSLYCIEKGDFGGVLQVKASEKNPLYNTTTLSRSRAELLEAAGSRYSPASPCEKLDLVEKLKKPSVVIGKPCDIAATVMAEEKKDELAAKVGIKIACFCAGTPSTEGSIQMLKRMDVSADKLTNLRYRGHGWPGKTYASEGAEQGASSSSMTYEQSWGETLQKYRQWRCYICPDHAGEFADIAVGDPWYKEVEEDDIGQSLFLVRTPEGLEIIQNAIADGFLVASVVDPDLLPQSQMNLKKTRSTLWGRLLALKIMRAGCPEFINFGLFSSWRDNLSLKQKMKSILSTIKRVFVKKLRQKQNVYSTMD